VPADRRKWWRSHEGNREVMRATEQQSSTSSSSCGDCMQNNNVGDEKEAFTARRSSKA
jgi:hypothetical protein